MTRDAILPAEAEPREAAGGELSVSPPEGVLSDITRLLVSEESLERVLEAVADALAEMVSHDALTLFVAHPPLRMLHPVLVRDRYSSEIVAMGSLPYGVGITGLAAETGIAQLVNDAHLDPRALLVPDTPSDPESLLAVPLLIHGELKGVLCLSRLGEGNGFTFRELRLAIVFSDLAALAIDNARSRARLEAEVLTDHLTALYNHRYFQERLAEEVRRASRTRTPVSLILYDIDDFKLVNDTHGHLVGDQVLQAVAALSRETCRSEDVICRIGGEEFGIILPGYSSGEGCVLAERLRSAVAGLSFPGTGGVTVSLGVAEAPLHASSPRELIACADLALLHAKAEGKDRTRVHRAGGKGTGARRALLDARGERRSAAQLRVLQNVSTKLNRLTDVREIGEALTAELRSLIDYHNCRVYVLQPDGATLYPMAFRGELMYEGETLEALLTKVGEGLTGHVAATGTSYYTPNAMEDSYAVSIPGTPDIDESILAVPLLYGERVTGVVVLSKLGIDQFDEEDLRLLEALSGSAAVAVENARLLEAERESAQTSGALLELSQALTRVNDMEEVLFQALSSIPSMLPCSHVLAWMRDPDTGSFRLLAAKGLGVEPAAVREVPPEVAERFLLSVREPFVLPVELVSQVPPEHVLMPEPREVLVAPMRWEPDGLGVLTVGAPHRDGSFTPRDIRLAGGIADITSLALANAHRFDELERTYLSTVEALANALEAKDEYTEDHCRALARMSLAVGAEMGLSPDRLKVLELGALFHDIGKIGIPSEIIRKSGSLTPAEWREMNRHPIIGAEILAPVAFLRPVRPIIRASHERWDGKGYPDGVAGEDIPLEARIVFVCDAFHAMTTNRPYRKALPEEDAIRRLRLGSGTQFDPAVVAVFTRLQAEGRIWPHPAH